jgi:hypothetical protein
LLRMLRLSSWHLLPSLSFGHPELSLPKWPRLRGAGQLIDAAAARQLTLFSSLPLLAELRAVLDRPKFAARLRERAVASTELFGWIRGARADRRAC